MSSFLFLSTHLVTTLIPHNCQEWIRKKACELLNTNNAIVAAPGFNEGKFVLSYSSSKPQLVVPSNTSVFACDSECPICKGLGICAHSVAVTEMNGKLSDYIEKVKKKKKTPKITKLAEATMPKGRGRKENEGPRKRKQLRPIWKILPLYMCNFWQIAGSPPLPTTCHQPIFLLIIITKHHPTSTNRKLLGAQLNRIIHLSYFVKYQAT